MYHIPIKSLTRASFMVSCILIVGHSSALGYRGYLYYHYLRHMLHMVAILCIVYIAHTQYVIVYPRRVLEFYSPGSKQNHDAPFNVEVVKNSRTLCSRR